MPGAVEHDVFIHLIGQQHDVGVARQFGQHGQILAVKQAAGRIVRRVDDDHACAWRDERTYLVPIRPVIREFELRIDRPAADSFDRRDVTVIDRLEYDDLVSATHEGGNRGEDGLRRAGRDGDFLVDVVARSVQRFNLVGNGRAQFRYAGHRWILVSSFLHGAQGRFEQCGFGLKIGETL